METFWNSDILKLIAVLLAIVVIVFLFLRYKSPEQNSKVHLYYISGLGIFIILELVTYICINNDNTTDIINYISFASTLSSLLLSVVAIIYAIVSNNKGEAQYQKIDRASDRISSSVDRFYDLSTNLSGNLNSILVKLDEIKNISDETNKAINQSNQQNYQSQTGTLVDSIIDSYINGGSYFGNLSLLACIYSKEKEKPFNTAQIIPDYSAYVYGYIIASSALQIIKTHVVNDHFVVDAVIPILKDKLILNINNYIETSIEGQKEYNRSLFMNIKALFGITE